MINRVLNHLEEWLIAFLMGAATIVIFVQVVHRYLSTVPGIQDYVLHINLGWAQELCIYMFVWMCKFGAAYGVRTGIHVGIDVLVNRLPVDWRKRTVLLALIGGALFTGIVGALGTRFVWENGMHYAVFHVLGLATDVPEGPTTPDLEWPTWAIYSAVPLGSFLMCFRFLQVMWGFVRTGDVPHHDHAHVDGLSDDDQTFDQPVLQGAAR